MAVTKKQVHYALIGGGILIAAVVLYKLLRGNPASIAAAVKNQQLAAAKSTGGMPGTTAAMAMPLSPVALSNADPNDPANIQISATSAPVNPTFGGVAVV